MKTNTAWASAIPLATVVLAFILGALRGPFYVLENVDPAYQYLFSSLALLDFTAPRHTDHPGTTLQMLGAFIIWVKWGWANLHSTVQNLESHVIAHSESYIKAINHVLIVLVGFSMFGAGRRLYRHTQCWLPVVILQLAPFFYVETVIAFYNVSPEPLLIAIIYGLIFYLIPMTLPLKPMPEGQLKKYAIGMGMIFGFGMATKVTFFPLLLLALLLPTFRLRFACAGVTLLTFIICTLPIIKRYKFMVKWNITVLEHSGKYGGGSSGLPSLPELWQNLELVFSLAPMLFVFLGLTAAGWLYLQFGHPAQSSCKQRVQRLLGCGILVMAAQLLVTIKHPGERYLLPAMIFSGYMCAILWYYVSTELLPKQQEALSAKTMSLTMLLVLSLTFYSTQSRFSELSSQRKAARTIDRITRQDNCLPMASYISVYKDFAFWFADNWNAQRLGPKLHGLKPEALFYEPTNDTFFQFSGPIERQDVQSLLDNGQCIYLQTTRQDLFDKALILESVAVEGLAKQYPLYQLKGFQNAQAS